MRNAIITAAALIVLAAGAKVLVLDTPATYSIEPQVGRYQTSVFGSHRRLQSMTFVIDSASGQTWSSQVVEAAEAWSEVAEEEGKAPGASATIGRYRLETEYTGNVDGFERAATVRIDTVTGRLWHIPFTARPMRWVLIRDPSAPGK